jgi:hypothetical protein
MTRTEAERTMSTDDTIAPIIKSAYGDNGMSRALIVHLALKIDAWHDRPIGADREDMVRMTCWDWFGGGGTAAHVAQKIEAALNV